MNTSAFSVPSLATLKRMLRKFLSTLLILAHVLTLAPAKAMEDEEIAHFSSPPC